MIKRLPDSISSEVALWIFWPWHSTGHLALCWLLGWRMKRNKPIGNK